MADEGSGQGTGSSLRVIEGPSAGQSVPLAKRVIVGRDRACDLLIADAEISRRHLRVTRENGHALVEDLGSSNGTFVNGERILQPREIHAGDQIEVGNTIIELSMPGSEPIIRHGSQQITAMRQVLAQPATFLTQSPSSRKWWTLVVVCTANFMLLLDTSIVSVALPSISNSLNTSFTQLQWIVDAYSLMLAVFLLTAGSLSDILGRRVVFVIGLVIFTVTSAICGLANSATLLDVARGVQGLGGGLMLAPSLALLAQEFPPAERPQAFAIWGAVTAGAIAAGPLAGGILTDAFSWQAIFWVNVPIGIVAIGFTLTKLVNLPGAPTSIDWFGLVTFSTASFMLIYALIRGNDEGWGSTLILALVIGGAVELIVFVIGETQVRSPMIDFSLFRKPTCSGASLVAFATSASALAMIIYITLWLQSILDYSALACGIRLLPLTALGLLVKPATGRYTAKLPPGAVLGGGLAFIAVGLGLMSQVDASSHWTVLLPGLILCGIGLGVVSPTLAQVAVGIVPPWQSGMASGINSTFRQLGLVIGIAGLGAVFQHAVLVNVTSTLKNTQAAYLTPTFSNSVASGGTVNFIKRAPDTLHPALTHAAQVSYSAGFSDILFIAAIVAVAGAVVAPFLVRRRDLVTMGPPPGGGPPGGGGPPQAGPPTGPPTGQLATPGEVPSV